MLLFMWGFDNIWRNGGNLSGATAAPVVVSNESVRAATDARVDGAPGLPRLMLIGNSVATTLTPGFRASRRVTVFNAAVIGCAFPPTIAAAYRNPLTHETVVDRPCHPSGEAAELAAFRPNVVLWVVSDLPGPFSYQGRTLQACSPQYDAVYKRALSLEIARMQRGRAKVVITTEAYVRFTTPGDGVGALALPDRTVDCNNALRRAVAAATHAQVVDLFAWTCPGGTCPVRRKGVVLRPGGLHYSGPGGDATAKWILSQIT